MGWELSIDFTFDRSFYELPAVVFKKRRENIAKNMQTRTPVFNENPQPFSALGEKFDYCVVFFPIFIPDSKPSANLIIAIDQRGNV